MGCGTSIYDPDLEENQSHPNFPPNLKGIISPLSKSRNKVRPAIENGSSNHDTNGVAKSHEHVSNNLQQPHTFIETDRQTNRHIPVRSRSPLDTSNYRSRSQPNGILCNSGSGRLSSPATSDRNEESRTVKHVEFRVESERKEAQEERITSVSGSCANRKSARRKRDTTLRNRLLSKMSEVESLSARLLLDSERLSLTSSMSRTTSRTGSPFPDSPKYRVGSPTSSMTFV